MAQDNLLKVYLTTVRPVLEYAAPVWQVIPGYLSDVIERVQKRALMIIYPDAESYTEALQITNIARLKKRRDDLCVNYVSTWIR